MDMRNYCQTTGLPKDKEYLEKDLPAYLNNSIKEWLEGINDPNCTLLDCLWGDLSGSINSALNDDEITAEQAEHLRRKYLGQDQ